MALMSSAPSDKPKRLKVRRNEEANVKELEKQGYTLKKEKGGRQVWEKTTQSAGSTPKASETDFKPNMLGGRLNMVAEKTGPKMKFMADKFPGGATGSGQANYGQKQTDRVVLKTKKPKEREPRMSQEDRQFARNERKAERVSQRTMDKMSRSGCRIYGGRKGY